MLPPTVPFPNPEKGAMDAAKGMQSTGCSGVIVINADRLAVAKESVTGDWITFYG
jgi:hypothetical protein